VEPYAFRCSYVRHLLHELQQRRSCHDHRLDCGSPVVLAVQGAQLISPGVQRRQDLLAEQPIPIERIKQFASQRYNTEQTSLQVAVFNAHY
jgi:hypothetical protein